LTCYAVLINMIRGPQRTIYVTGNMG